MAGGGAKDGAPDENGEQEDHQSVSLKKPRTTVTALLHKAVDGINMEEISNGFKGSIARMREDNARTVDRIKRDNVSSEAGKKWHRAINIQLDIHEDVTRFLKALERGLREAEIIGVTEDGIVKLIAGAPIGVEELCVITLTSLPDVVPVIKELNGALEIVSKRSLELSVVKSAPDSRTGYKALDLMSNVGSLSVCADKCLKEAIRINEEEDRASKKSKTSNKSYPPRSESNPRGWGGSANNKPGYQGGYQGRSYDREPEWERRETFSNNSSPGPPRGGSQSMPYGGKGGKGGNDGACNVCHEMGHWARHCPRKRTEGW